MAGRSFVLGMKPLLDHAFAYDLQVLLNVYLAYHEDTAHLKNTSILLNMYVRGYTLQSIINMILKF